MSKKKSLSVCLFTENGKKMYFKTKDQEKIDLVVSIMTGDFQQRAIPIPSAIGRIIGEALDNAALGKLQGEEKVRKDISFPSEREAFNAGANAWDGINEFKKAYGIENGPLETSAHRAGWMGCYRWLISLLHPDVKPDSVNVPKCQG